MCSARSIPNLNLILGKSISDTDSKLRLGRLQNFKCVLGDKFKSILHVFRTICFYVLHGLILLNSVLLSGVQKEINSNLWAATSCMRQLVEIDLNPAMHVTCVKQTFAIVDLTSLDAIVIFQPTNQIQPINTNVFCSSCGIIFSRNPAFLTNPLNSKLVANKSLHQQLLLFKTCHQYFIDFKAKIMYLFL